MTQTTTPTRQFKKSNPEEIKAAALKPRGTGYISSFKDASKKHKWHQGRNSLRLLPQQESSNWGNFCEYSKFGMYGGNIQGEFAFDPDGPVSKLIYEVSKTLRAHPEFKFEVKSKDNETGVSINTSPRVAFLGFNFDCSENGVKIIDLPGTFAQKKDGKASIEGAGTTITKAIYDTDIRGVVKFGDIFDITTGRVVCVDVQNAGTVRAKYTISIDAEFPIEGAYEGLLDEVAGFDNFIDFKELQEAKEILRQYLPQNMVDNCFQLND